MLVGKHFASYQMQAISERKSIDLIVFCCCNKIANIYTIYTVLQRDTPNIYIYTDSIVIDIQKNSRIKRLMIDRSIDGVHDLQLKYEYVKIQNSAFCIQTRNLRDR